MKKILSRLKTDEKGQALILALILLAVGGLIITPLLGFMGTGLMAAQSNETKMAEYYAADAGVEEGIWQLAHGGLAVAEGTPATLAPFTINGKIVEVTIENLVDDSAYKITSTAGSTTIVAYIIGINSDLVYGDFELPYNVEIEGDIAATGDIILNDKSEVEGNVCAGGDIILDGHAEVEEGTCLCAGGDLYVNWGGDGSTGNAEIRNNVYVVGDLYVGEFAEIEGDVYVGGTIYDPYNNILGNIYPYEPCPCSGCLAGAVVQNWEII